MSVKSGQLYIKKHISNPEIRASFCIASFIPNLDYKICQPLKCLLSHCTKNATFLYGRWCLLSHADLQGTASPVRYVITSSFFPPKIYVKFDTQWIWAKCTWAMPYVYWYVSSVHRPWDTYQNKASPFSDFRWLLFWRKEMHFASIFDFSQWCVTIIFLNNNVRMQVSVLVGCSMCRVTS